MLRIGNKDKIVISDSKENINKILEKMLESGEKIDELKYDTCVLAKSHFEFED